MPDHADTIAIRALDAWYAAHPDVRLGPDAARSLAEYVAGAVRQHTQPAPDLRFQWSAGEVCFDCPCGVKEIILSEGGEEETCGCGRVYRLVHYVALKD